jgi:2-oxoglutarate dehydrogenase E1 component
MMQQYRANSYLFGGNAPYVEELYEAYLDNPGSVPDNWRTYFDNLQHVPAVDGSEARDVAHAPVIQSFAQRAKANAFISRVQRRRSGHRAQAGARAVADRGAPLLGARWADLDPLKRPERPKIPELEPAFYDLNESDMDITFSATNTYFSKARAHDAARDPAGAARDLLRHHRRGDHAHHEPARSAGGRSGWRACAARPATPPTRRSTSSSA